MWKCHLVPLQQHPARLTKPSCIFFLIFRSTQLKRIWSAMESNAVLRQTENALCWRQARWMSWIPSRPSAVRGHLRPAGADHIMCVWKAYYQLRFGQCDIVTDAKWSPTHHEDEPTPAPLPSLLPSSTLKQERHCTYFNTKTVRRDDDNEQRCMWGRVTQTQSLLSSPGTDFYEALSSRAKTRPWKVCRPPSPEPKHTYIRM